MKKPIVKEVFADNGEHSHWCLVDSETCSVLWEEYAEESAQLSHNKQSAPCDVCSGSMIGVSWNFCPACGRKLK